MIRNLLYILIQLFLVPLTAYSQHTFNVRETETGTNYQVVVNLNSRTVSAGNSFCVSFYQAKVLDGGIAFSLRQGQEPSLKPNLDDWFFCIKSTTIGFYNPKTIKFVKGDPIDNTAYTQAYNRLSEAIKMGDSTPAPTNKEPSSVSSGSNHTYTVNGVSFTMVFVEGGTFTMGATPEQGYEDTYGDEKPAHRVTLDDYYIGQTEVTQELWQAVMGNNPSKFKGNKHPVECVSWNDCQTFISRVNSLTGQRFRLPTEAEWEYAARGGNQRRGYKYSGSNFLSDVAWYYDNAFDGIDDDSPDYGTHNVATKSPNELGIYDMTGNVFEWCQDWEDGDYYSRSPQSNPMGPSSGSSRVYRGGSWNYGAWSCRVACRFCHAPDDRDYFLGLRLVL